MKAYVIGLARSLYRSIIHVVILNVTCILHKKHITAEVT